jgi:hypothetical protein
LATSQLAEAADDGRFEKRDAGPQQLQRSRYKSTAGLVSYTVPSSHSFSVWRIPRGDALVRGMRDPGRAWQVQGVVVCVAFSVWRIPRGDALARAMRVPGRTGQVHGVVVCVAFSEWRISRRNALVRGLRNRTYGKHRCKRRSQKKLLHDLLRGISLAQDRASMTRASVPTTI